MESKIIAIVERIEKTIVMLETREHGLFQVPMAVLPKGVSEGNVLQISFRIDPELERERRQQIRDLQRS